MAITLTAGLHRVDFGDLAAVAGQTAFSICLTIKAAASGQAASQRLIGQWGNANAEQAFLVSLSGSTNLTFICANAAGVSRHRNSNTGFFTANALHRLVLRWRASDQVQSVMDNGSVQTLTNIVNNSPATIGNATSAVQVGSESDSSTNASPGDYSEVAIFGRYLVDEEAVAYGKGVSPERLGRSNRILYARLLNTTDLVNLWSGVAGTLTGGANAVHPPMIYAPPRGSVKAPVVVEPPTPVFRSIHLSGVV